MPTSKKAQAKKDESPWSEERRLQKQEDINAYLRGVADMSISIEESVEYRTDGGLTILIPAGMEKKDAARFLEAEAESEEEMHQFSKEDLKCRPLDGANAFNQVLKELYGVAAVGEVVRGWGGTQLPEEKQVRLSATETVSVPWGILKFPPWDAYFNLHERMDKDFGVALNIAGAAKKRYAGEIAGLFMLVERFLKEHSIFRNRALVGCGVFDSRTGQYQDPEFLDAYAIDRKEIVYNSEVYNSLHHGLWGRIKNRELLESIGRPFNPKVLLWGENGTGKSVAGLISAQFCLENDMTFIQARPDENLSMVLKFAEHVGTPSLVMVEDGEKLIKNNPEALDQLLEDLDGLRTKGRHVGLMITSNFPKQLPRSVLRARRISRAIYVSDLDAEALHELINRKIPEEQREELDYKQLEDGFRNFKPSWIVQVLEDSVTASVIRTGKVNEKLATDDFLQEASVMRQLHDLYEAATDVAKPPTLDTVIASIVTENVTAALQKHMVDLSDGEIMVRA